MLLCFIILFYSRIAWQYSVLFDLRDEYGQHHVSNFTRSVSRHIRHFNGEVTFIHVPVFLELIEIHYFSCT